jgi:hypothetical protein
MRCVRFHRKDQRKRLLIGPLFQKGSLLPFSVFSTGSFYLMFEIQGHDLKIQL